MHDVMGIVVVVVVVVVQCCGVFACDDIAYVFSFDSWLSSFGNSFVNDFFVRLIRKKRN